MEGPWVTPIVGVFGVLFAIGGALSAFLQAKWLRDQRRTLQLILNVLQATRADDVKKESVSNPVHEEVDHVAIDVAGRECSGNGGAGPVERVGGRVDRAATGSVT
jgi:hypothetical protein